MPKVEGPSCRATHTGRDAFPACHAEAGVQERCEFLLLVWLGFAADKQSMLEHGGFLSLSCSGRITLDNGR
jgi:hypothetical protein